MRVLSSMIFLLIWIVALCAFSSGEYILSNHKMQNRVCQTPGCIDAAQRILQNMDKSIEPCDNFYQFACGNYMKSQENFTGNKLTEIDRRLNVKLKESIESKIDESDCRTLRLLKSHYLTCLDNEGTSMELFSDILSQLGGWPVLVGKSWNETTFDWKHLMYELRRIGYKNSMNSFVILEIQNGETNNTQLMITLDRSKTGLHLAYLNNTFESKKVQAYYKYVVDIATALGADRRYAEIELSDSLKFEMELAKIESPGRFTTIKEWQLESENSGIPWNEYVNKLLCPHHIVNSTKHIFVNPYFLNGLGNLISKTPKRVLANYALWRVVQESIPFMPTQIQEIKAKFDLLISGVEFRPRWQQCIRHLRDNMALAVGALYVRKSFGEKFKKEVEELVEYVRESFKDTLGKFEWMDEKTRKTALKKLKLLHSHVAYPDELLDDEIIDKHFRNLKDIPNNYLDSYLSASLFELDNAYQQLGKRYNTTTWITHGEVAMANAFYRPFENSLTIPAGIFDEELFAIDRTNYLNYGSMGFIVGHEMAHAFGIEGSKRDEEGNVVYPWDMRTLVHFGQYANCLVEQYNNYTVRELQVNVDGRRNLEENIADNGGIKQAYLAYEEYEKRNGTEPHLPGLSYSPRQLFWLYSANFHCAKYSPTLFKYRYDIHPHTPEEFRVIGAFSNIPEFARDFECPFGSPMNPMKKCTIW